MADKTTKENRKLAGLTRDELFDELRESKNAALNLRFRNATGQLENTAEITKVRRHIARINTQIRQRELSDEAEG